MATFTWINRLLLDTASGAAVQRVALEVMKDAKQFAPVDTGNLRRSITATGDGTDWQVGTNVEYAVYQEFGTSRMRAQPFLGPALNAAKAKYGGRFA